MFAFLNIILELSHLILITRGKSPPGQLPVAMGTLGSCALGLGPALDSP